MAILLLRLVSCAATAFTSLERWLVSVIATLHRTIVKSSKQPLRSNARWRIMNTMAKNQEMNAVSRIMLLENKVQQLYEAKYPTRTDWADWLYQHHVFVVANYADQLAKRHGADRELVIAASILHDIADAVMSRFHENHTTESLAIARTLLQESGFSNKEISIIVDDAIARHSCYDGDQPMSLEGKILATADAMAHLTTDFYIHAIWSGGTNNVGLDEIKRWATDKLNRDFCNKICFEDVKSSLQKQYDTLVVMFST